MKRFFTAATLSISAVVLVPTPAFALAVELDDALCPIEGIGEAELDSWTASLADSQGEMNDAQTDTLGASVQACAEKLGWNESDTLSAVEFNISIIASTAIGDKLTSDGVNAVDYEVVLENRSADDLRQVMADPDNSPAVKELIDKMIADLGDGLTDEIAADLAAYIAFMAQSQLSAMKMMELAD
jgi:hypothetical protein